MSHPPETSLTSLELAEQIWRDPGIQFAAPDNDEHWKRVLDRLAAIIDAYVGMRLAEDRWKQHAEGHSSNSSCSECNKFMSALATARKQLEEKKGEPA